MATRKGNRKAAAEVINDHVVSMIENAGAIPWSNPIVTYGLNHPRGVDGRLYRGANNVICAVTAWSRGYSDHRWLTKKKAEQLGGRVVGEEKPTPITWYKRSKKEETDDEGNKVQVGRMYLGVWYVYNVNQTEGCALPPLTEYEPPVWADGDEERAEQAVALVLGMKNPPQFQVAGSMACYSPAHDTVHVPPRDQVSSGVEWAGMVIHEGAHSTGHKDRLNRKEVQPGSMPPFGSPDYSREELVAELTTAYVCGYMGIATPEYMRSSDGYLQSWLSALKDDPKALILAGARAQKAMDYILGETVVEQETPKKEAVA